MTKKTLWEKIEKLGGTVEWPSAVIKLPHSLRIKNKSEAINLLDILSNFLDNEGVTYQINEEIAFKALRRAIKRGDIETPGVADVK